jgi:hypothetical protein
MNSNERPWRPDWRPSGFHQKPPVQEIELLRREITVERKIFSLVLKENPRGLFVRIVERNGNRADSIIIPAPGLKDFHQLLVEMVRVSQEIAPKTKP